MAAVEAHGKLGAWKETRASEVLLAQCRELVDVHAGVLQDDAGDQEERAPSSSDEAASALLESEDPTAEREDGNLSLEAKMEEMRQRMHVAEPPATPSTALQSLTWCACWLWQV